MTLMNSRSQLPQVKGLSSWQIALNIALLIGAGLALWLMYRSYSLGLELSNAETHFRDAQLLSAELRGSSNNLTLMARSYAMTGDQHFKDYFHQIADERNGVIPAFSDGYVYWDLKIAGLIKDQPATGEGVSLRSRFEALGITEQELWLLKEAEDNSNQLIEMELAAFKLADNGRYGEAAAILFSEAYFQEKARIMTPIGTFNRFFSERTEAQLEETRQAYMVSTYSAYLSLVVLLLLIVTRAYIDYQQSKTRIYELEFRVKEKTGEIEEQNVQLKDAYDSLAMSQAKLVELEKVKVMSELIPGVAHEINTPVGIAVTLSTTQLDTLDVLKKQIDANQLTRSGMVEGFETLSSSASAILKNMRKINYLIMQFKGLSPGNQIDQVGKTSLVSLVDEVFLFSRNDVPENLKIDFVNNVPGLLEVNTYPYLLSLCLRNVIDNAVYHGLSDKGEGHVTVEASMVEERVVIKIIDDGIGMDESVRDKVFSPFFSTTKNKGNPGLGLNVVQTLVTQRLGGDIWCVSHVGEGTTFFIEIPASIIDALGA